MTQLRHTWMEGIQVRSNKGPHPSSRGDNIKMIKIYGKNIKIFYFRTKWPVSTKLGIKHPWVEEIQIFYQIKSHALLQG